jgi:hypothetical protein
MNNQGQPEKTQNKDKGKEVTAPKQKSDPHVIKKTNT